MTVPSIQENERLLQGSQLGDIQAQEMLYTMNRGLVHMVAARFDRNGYDYEELFQVGSIGLLKAIRHFDPTYQVKFSTYAVPMILGEIRRFMRENQLVHLQRSVQEKHRLIRRAEEELRQRLGQEPTVQQMARELHMPCEEIAGVLEVCQPPRYLEEPVFQPDGKTVLLEQMTAPKGGEQILEKLSLQEALQQLPDRERIVLQHRFFKEETQEVIAQKLGISQVQVSRIEKRALKRLRETF